MTNAIIQQDYVNSNVDITNIIKHSMAKNTRIAYRKGWQRFTDYCTTKRLQALPANEETVANFFVHLGNTFTAVSEKPLSMGTINIWHSAINAVHKLAGYNSPTKSPKVELIMQGLKRLRGTAPRQVMALREKHIKAMLKKCPQTPIGLRDAAIISIGFAAALRRSEIINLTVDDIEFLSDTKNKASGMYVHIRKSKTDQEGKGQKVAIPEGKILQPIKRLKKWIKVSNIQNGFLFQTMSRGGKSRGRKMHHSDIPRIVKHYAALIGLDAGKISGHSLRAGFVTSAVAHHARLDKIMAVTRHKNPSTVLNYMRDSEAFDEHAGKEFL